MDTQKFKDNGHNKYPVSTETLDMLQQQTQMVAQLCRIMGLSYYILKQSSVTEEGLMIWNNELMPLRGTPTNYIQVITESESVTAYGETYTNIRTRRYAQYTSVYSSGCQISSYLNGIDKSYCNTNYQLYKLILERDKMLPPVGAVIDFYGTATCSNLKKGWIPCGCLWFQNEEARTAEKNRWTNRYGSDNITFVEEIATEGLPGLRITSVTINGTAITVPDLTDRFIVTAGNSYNLGATGGENYHTLTVGEMPSHKHEYFGDDALKSRGGDKVEISQEHPGYDADSRDSGASKFYYTTPAGGGDPHENRPPYYALYKIMRVM